MLAINICLLSTVFDLVALPLSQIFCDSIDGSTAYVLASSAEKKLGGCQGYPHCCLLRLIIHSSALGLVKDIIRRIWLDHKPLMNDIHLRLNPVVQECKLKNGWHIPFISIDDNAFLSSLRQELWNALRVFHLVLEPSEAVLTCSKSFPIDTTLLNSPDEFLVNFGARNSDNYSPHITLGASQEENFGRCRPVDVTLHECQLAVSHVGGFLSCGRLL